MGCEASSSQGRRDGSLLEMINVPPSRCSGFPASSAASRRSGRSGRSRYPNEGEENRRVGGLIGHTWKTTVSSLKCKTEGDGIVSVFGATYFPQTPGRGGGNLPLFRQLSFLRFLLSKIVGENRNEATQEQHKYYPRHRSAESGSVTRGKIPSGNLLYSVWNEPLPRCRAQSEEQRAHYTCDINANGAPLHRGGGDGQARTRGLEIRGEK